MEEKNVTKKPNTPFGHDGGFPLVPSDFGWRIKIPTIKVEIERFCKDAFDSKKWKEDNA